MQDYLASAWLPHHNDGFSASDLQLTSKLLKPNLSHAAVMFPRFASVIFRLLHAQIAGLTPLDDFPFRTYRPTFAPELD